MNHVGLKGILVLSAYLVGVSALVFSLPITSVGAEVEDAQINIGIDVSPNIINIESERWGDIRILTDVRYSSYAANGHSIFVYFNGSDSVENIRATRDSLGNLIVKFSLEDLLVLESWLKPNAANDVKVIVSMDNGDEYVGQSEVYITKKR
jgi:hypothetical protein